jgi:steroid 5-alpha reductase family enzyme
MWLISLPLLTAQLPGNPVDLQFIDIAGIGFWLVGFSFEVLGDWQLSRFRSNPDNRGKVLRSGLWRYSRHPNYFGDAVLWWGYGFLGASSSLGLWPLLSPVLMTYLLLRVSGVVLLEKSLAGQKDGYREYQQTTSAFFPWFPKKAP